MRMRGLWFLALGCALGCSGSEGSVTTDDTSGGSTSMVTSTTGSTSTTSASTTGVDSTGATSDASSGSTGGLTEVPTVLFPRTSILPEEVAVVANTNDALSMQIADVYVQARGIPAANRVDLTFSTAAVLPASEFEVVADELAAQLGDEIQALALAFTNPYRVDCMSVTSAFTFGFDLQWCNTSGQACGETAESPYWESASLAPWTDHGIRPAMMLAAETIEDAEALIDRGIASDGTHPVGDGYFVRTTDMARSIRWPIFEITVAQWDHDAGLDLFYIDNADGMGSNAVANTQDVLFYFTGLANVPDVETNTYLPGAVADHLTSFGGQVPQSSQMSALRWLEAGATGSFGTVVEPCAVLAKFPDTSVLLSHYFRGQTLIEAYYKSVRWPGEGLFIGEPLARPWDGSTVELVDGDLHITTTLLAPGVTYDIEKSDTADGPWEHVLSGSIPFPQTFTIEVPDADRPYYRISPQQ